ncbi:MAG: DUF4922 domain-containing protein [Bacteroidales bacterium]
MNYSQQADLLLEKQVSEWDLARQNYLALDKVRVREIDFDSFVIRIQYNPGRIVSSSARVDKESIVARPCFLCETNRPAQQRGITFNNDIDILVNPFPIFPRHFTIVSKSHTEQRIAPNFGEMLLLSEAMTDHVIFYNGPECGASAPDHFHFQAGNKGFLGIEQDFKSGRLCNLAGNRKGLSLFAWRNYSRGMLTIRGSEIEEIKSFFYRFYKRLDSLSPGKTEPMLNIISMYEDGQWIIHILPRKLHRPTQYFAEGSGRILLSPASVDLAGVLIVPREEDFEKITKVDILDIFSQVCLNENVIDEMLEDLI